MDLAWLVRNMRNSWKHSDRIADFVRRLRWIYADKLACPNIVEIGFRYPEPIGRCRLTVRANHGSDAFVCGEVFEHEYYRLPLIEEPATILDLGANAGFTTIYFSRLYPNARLACVEPMKNNVDILRQNLKSNNVKAVIFDSAVARADGVVDMRVCLQDYGHKVATSHDVSVGPIVQVKAMSMPSIMRTLGWERIGLLKVDIEGYESVLLKGECPWLAQVDNICIECHEDFGEPSLRQLAERYGFEAPRCLAGIWLLVRNCGTSAGRPAPMPRAV